MASWLTTELVVALVGGVGLLLIGMSMLTEGLRLSAGNALRQILERWTGTTLRGIGSGAFITALVQSSSAVTVATIGFVNAGVLSLERAIAVVFGSNVGTTVTGWIVASVGVDVDIDALALPLIGLGGIVHLVRPNTRVGAVGQALAGFGLFFLGIETLQSGFQVAAVGVDPSRFGGGGLGTLLIVAVVGFVLTTAMQSSSAAIAITLTAAAGGALSIEAAAAMVIGANVGTTSTAALAVLGAGANARRVAVAHIVFNVISGVLAFALLPVLVRILVALPASEGGRNPAVVLALFHTVFNVLGVAVCAPLTPLFVKHLSNRFRTSEEDLAKPQFLDSNLVPTPTLALEAVRMELVAIGEIARRMGAAAISSERGGAAAIRGDQEALRARVAAVGEFVVELQRVRLSQRVIDALPTALRLTNSYVEIGDMAVMLAQRHAEIRPIADPELRDAVTRFRRNAAATLAESTADAPHFRTAALERFATLDEAHDEVRAALLRGAAERRISAVQLAETLEAIGLARRMAKRASTALRFVRRLEGVEQSFEDSPHVDLAHEDGDL